MIKFYVIKNKLIIKYTGIQMEQINFEHSSIDTNYINKLYDQEKQDRLGNLKKKCLETVNKIVNIIYLKFYFSSTLKNLKI